jgi:Sulfotransferase family
MSRCFVIAAIISSLSLFTFKFSIEHGRDIKHALSISRASECNDLFANDCPSPVFTGPADMKDFFDGFRERGGIIFFLHNPKTGGTTVREFFQRQISSPDLYLETHTRQSWEMAEGKIEHYVQHGTNGTTVIVEDHVYPSIYRVLMPRLRRWKSTAAEHQVPIFVFSMVRDPLSRYVSGFNYYKVQNKQQDPTLQNFLKYVKSEENVQCKFFLHMNCAASESTARKRQLETLLHVVDWISPTSRLSSDLLPMLAYMATLNASLNVGIVQPKAFGPRPNRTLLISDLSKSDMLDQVARYATIDADLYDLVLRHYNFTRFRDYLAEVVGPLTG